MNELQSTYESIIDQIRSIDTSKLSDKIERDTATKIVEKQKVYFWIRLYLKEELGDITPGDDFEICYTPSGEKLTTKFVAFGKKNLNRDLDNVIVNYDPEDEPKTLCLMVDEDDMKADSIPFIRTLFKMSSFFEFQVYRRNELTFTNKRTDFVCEYIDVDF